MTALLEVDELTTGYDHVPVLRDVHLSVGRGEIVGLLGANGAGKTTLLRALSGTLEPWEGHMTLGGAPLNGMASWDRVGIGIAHVPEGRHIFGAMSVSDNLAVAGLAADDPRGRRDEVLETFPRLWERRDQAAETLSGGEQQMLAIGRALMTDPKALLLDELSAGLAPVITQDLLASLRAIHDRGVAVLIVEQSPHLVASLIDRAYLLEQGRIAGEGTIEDLGGVDRIAERYLGLH